MTQDQKPSFEAALEELQVTVKRLESGELSLEHALKHFENGVRLSRICQEQLAAAEQRVEIRRRLTAKDRLRHNLFLLRAVKNPGLCPRGTFEALLISADFP